MLDVSIRLGVLNLLADLRDTSQLAILYVTHDIASARYLADTIVVMYAGELVESAPSTELTDAPAHPYTQLLLSAAPAPARAEPPVLAGAAARRAWCRRRPAAGSTRAARTRWPSAGSSGRRRLRSRRGIRGLLAARQRPVSRAVDGRRPRTGRRPGPGPGGGGPYAGRVRGGGRGTGGDGRGPAAHPGPRLRPLRRAGRAAGSGRAVSSPCRWAARRGIFRCRFRCVLATSPMGDFWVAYDRTLPVVLCGVTP